MKPKLGPLLPMIGTILEADRTALVKQRHTVKRIFERLRDEHGFGDGYAVVKDYIRSARARIREENDSSLSPGRATICARCTPRDRAAHIHSYTLGETK